MNTIQASIYWIWQMALFSWNKIASSEFSNRERVGGCYLTLTGIRSLMNLMDDVSIAVVTSVTISLLLLLFFFKCILRVIFNCQYIMMTGKPCLKCVPNAITKNKNMPFNETVSWTHLLLHLLLTDSCTWLWVTSVRLGASRCFLGRGEMEANSWATGPLVPSPGALGGLGFTTLSLCLASDIALFELTILSFDLDLTSDTALFSWKWVKMFGPLNSFRSAFTNNLARTSSQRQHFTNDHSQRGLSSKLPKQLA